LRRERCDGELSDDPEFEAQPDMRTEKSRVKSRPAASP
jgi:hypothetical protein